MNGNLVTHTAFGHLPKDPIGHVLVIGFITNIF